MQLSELLLAGGLGEMTSFSSSAYLLFFFPACLALYALIPKNGKKYFLLFASAVFYWLISGTLIVYLAVSVLSIHYFGLWLDRLSSKRSAAVKEAADREEKKAIKKKYTSKSRAVLALAVCLHIGVLLTLKYSPFFTSNVNSLLELLKVSFRFEIPSYLQPIGISFFTLQAVSYITDVYRGVVKADENIGRLALYMSFFPQIVEGPICRYGQTAEALWNVSQIKFENLTFGLQRVAFGLMKKIVIADRLNQFVKNVFGHYDKWNGGLVAIAAVAYTVQLYMDFSGAMDGVVGTAEIFGVKMPENFERPFFSKTISEFWKRWHVTLGAWFKDYIFYPVTMSKSMKKLTSSARKKLGNHLGPLLAGSIALFCVWLSNGLWHGAGWNYIFFGMYHFVLILLGSLVAPAVNKVNGALHIKPDWFGYRVLQMLRTSVLVVIGELFFRADGLRAGFSMFKKMVTDFTFPAFDEKTIKILNFGKGGIAVVALGVLIVFVVSVLNERGISVREELRKRNVVLRWIVLLALVMFILVAGAYGMAFAPVDPLYAEF